ncbi:MAG: phosphoglycerate mutase (2,3-diphosphoglycerate-independent), partial [Nitrospirae bacterium]
MTTNVKPVALVILDGWGVSQKTEANALALARLPFYNSLLRTCPYTMLSASGEDTGLPDKQMGNSEVGHMNLGAGRIVYQDFTRINRAIRDGSFATNPVIAQVLHKVRSTGGRLHLLGLLSDGGVHSHIAHLEAILELVKKEGRPPVFVHAFLDGRDTPPRNGLGYIKSAEARMRQLGVGTIATVMGRYYAMDRDQRWDRVAKAYAAIVEGTGVHRKSAEEAVTASYVANVTDEFVVPAVIVDQHDHPIGSIDDDDGIFFYNFRADRARELTRALIEPTFEAFPPFRLTRILPELISERGLKQLRIAETEKYAHVTYFFNGGDEKTYPGEDRVLIPSPRDVATYDLKPQMSAREVADEAVRRIESRQYHLIVLNFANPDMVGHTGNLQAAIQAAEVIDECLNKVISAMRRIGGAVVLTADHGNLEQMVDYETGQPH